eukprot:gene10025-7002_t
MLMRRFRWPYQECRAAVPLCAPRRTKVSSGTRERQIIPRGMQPFGEVLQSSPQQTHTILPPWPVDSIEFNAASSDGGHSWRLAQELQERSLSGRWIIQSATLAAGPTSAPKDNGPAADVAQRAVPDRSTFSVSHLERLAAVEASVAGQQAMESEEGGWVCVQCCCVLCRTPLPLASSSWTMVPPLSSAVTRDPLQSDTEAEAGAANIKKQKKKRTQKKTAAKDAAANGDAAEGREVVEVMVLPDVASRTICPRCWTPRDDVVARRQQHFLDRCQTASVANPPNPEQFCPWWMCGRCFEINVAAASPPSLEPSQSGETEASQKVPDEDGKAPGGSEGPAGACRCCGAASATDAVLTVRPPVALPLTFSSSEPPSVARAQGGCSGIEISTQQEDPPSRGASHHADAEDAPNAAESAGSAPTPPPQSGPLVHSGPDYDVASRPLNALVNMRNKSMRWRCGCCREINSLQCRHCRNCRAERFGVRVRCPSCAAWRELSNAVVYGDPISEKKVKPAALEGSDNKTMNETQNLEDAIASFGPHNCFSPLAATLRCLRCSDVLHGGSMYWIVTKERALPAGPADSPLTVAAPSHGWWCGCGMSNPLSCYSCVRCRLPRWIPAAQRESVVCRHWDRDGSSNWWCESCATINPASARVVVLSAESSTPPGTPRAKTTRMRHGRTHCSCCGAPWHCELLQDDVVSVTVTEQTGNDDVRGIRTMEGEPLEAKGAEAESFTAKEKEAARSTWSWGPMASPRCWWRCACHTVNRGGTRACSCCGLPARSDLSCATISSWFRGDWLCSKCGRHNYREPRLTPYNPSRMQRKASDNKKEPNALDLEPNAPDLEPNAPDLEPYALDLDVPSPYYYFFTQTNRPTILQEFHTGTHIRSFSPLCTEKPFAL